MVGDDQLIVPIIGQQGILYFCFPHSEFLSRTHGHPSYSFVRAADRYLAHFLNGIQVDDVRALLARLWKEVVRQVDFEPFVLAARRAGGVCK